MRRLLVAAAVVVSTISMSSAQKFEGGADFGYGFGIGDYLGSNVVYNANSDTVSWKDVYGSKGKGIKVMGEATFYLNENFGIMAMSGYSAGEFSTKNEFTTFTKTYTTKTNYVPVNIGVKFRTKIGPIIPYIYMAPGLYFPNEKQILSYSGPLAVTLGLTDKTTTFSFSTGYGFTAGIGAAVTVFDKMGIKLEITPTFVFAKVTQSTTTQQGAADQDTIYVNDTPTLPVSTTPGISYANGQPVHTFTSVAIKAGVYYSF